MLHDKAVASDVSLSSSRLKTGWRSRVEYVSWCGICWWIAVRRDKREWGARRSWRTLEPGISPRHKSYPPSFFSSPYPESLPSFQSYIPSTHRSLAELTSAHALLTSIIRKVVESYQRDSRCVSQTPYRRSPHRHPSSAPPAVGRAHPLSEKQGGSLFMHVGISTNLTATTFFADFSSTSSITAR